MQRPSLFARLCSLAFAASFVGASCGQSSLALMPGVVNNPGNLSLRRGIFGFAQSQICIELKKRSVPLQLRQEDPATGRYFPNSCATQELANGNMLVQFGGYGYAWTNLTKRITFDANAAIEYQHDFLMHDSAMYVYFREKATTATTFTTRLVEQTPQSPVVGLPGGSTQGFLDLIGTEVLRKELGKGFTIIRDADGHVDFGVGMVEKGKRPTAPYTPADNGRLVLANERVEVHQNQRDYVGPFEVTESKQALFLSVAIDGAQNVDVMVVHRGIGEAWLVSYTSQATLAQPPAPPVLDEPVTSGMVWRKTLPLPKGQYYVVFDNSPAAGRSAPPVVVGDDRAVLVNYAVELGPAP
jgi:hypothetical protein